MSGRYGRMALDDRFHTRLRAISEKLSELLRRNDADVRQKAMISGHGEERTVEQIISLSDDPNRGMALVHKLAKQLLHAVRKGDREYESLVMADLTRAVRHVHEDDVLYAAHQLGKAKW